MARLVSIDFTGVEAGGFVKIPQGDYHVRLKKVVGKKGESSGKKYLSATFVIAAGKKKGSTLAPHSFSLQKQSLWNLRNFLEAAGLTVKPKAMNIDLDKMVGLESAATIVDDEPFEGKVKSIISAFFPLEDLGSTSDTGEELEDALEAEEEATEEEAAEEEEEKPKKPAKKPAKKVVEEEEEEPEAEAEEEEEEKPAKPAKKKAKKVEAEEESEEEDLFS